MIGEAGQEQFIFVGFVIAGLTAAALASLCWHLPAFFGFLAGATLPLAGACLCLTGYRYAATILETLDLQSAVRDALHRLDETRAELERAKRHKWRVTLILALAAEPARPAEPDGGETAVGFEAAGRAATSPSRR